MEEWQRRFRLHVVEVFRTLPRDGPDVRIIASFAEAVGADLGPRLRNDGWSDPAMPAELYAAHRACYWRGIANKIAAWEATLDVGVGGGAGDPVVARLAARYAEEPLLREGLRRHSAMLPPAQAAAVARLDAHTPAPPVRTAPRSPFWERAVAWSRRVLGGRIRAAGGNV